MVAQRLVGLEGLAPAPEHLLQGVGVRQAAGLPGLAGGDAQPGAALEEGGVVVQVPVELEDLFGGGGGW